MFDTHPEAEITLARSFSPSGQRSWHWVELSLQIPFFLLSVNLETEEGCFRREFLFSQIKDALGLISASRSIIDRLEIGLLSPGYMNGSNTYQLGRVKEVWKRRNGHEQLFVMADESRLHFPPNVDGMQDREMELVLSL
ncbi:MAG: hypothetical protein ABIG70_01035 [Pseudomonadota bacterium]